MGASGLRNVAPDRMVPLPAGTTLSLLPDSRPLGRDFQGNVRLLPRPDARPVAALLPTGYTRLLTPAYEKLPGTAHMPLFGYTAVAGHNGRVYASAMALDPGAPWDPAEHNTPDLDGLIAARIEAQPDNRLLAHHAHCASEYGCYTAQNLFYQRNEIAIAVSVACNAACVGCISEQLGDIEAPQDRIRFTPTVDEIVSLALPHLGTAPDAMVSFGQGCEGEPLLRARLIARAIGKLRQATNRGQLHINTNGSNPRALQLLIDEGLDSVRVSMFSAGDERHNAYYGPRNYGLSEMEECLRLARRQGLHCSINLLAYPGFTDTPAEVEALLGFIRRSEAQLVQMRTLNMDRELLNERVGFPDEAGIGIENLMARITDETGAGLGSYTPYLGRAYAGVSG